MSCYKGLILAAFIFFGCASSQNIFTETELVSLRITAPQEVIRGEAFEMSLEVANRSGKDVRFCADPGTLHFVGKDEIKSLTVSTSPHPSCDDVQIVPAGSAYKWIQRITLPPLEGVEFSVRATKEILAPASCKRKKCFSWVVNGRTEVKVIGD